MCGKNAKNTLSVGQSLATEQRLNHFHRPLTYFSITDCVGFLFGSPGSNTNFRYYAKESASSDTFIHF